MILFFLGFVILFVTLREVFLTVLVPRGKFRAFRITPFVVHKCLWPAYRCMASKVPSPVWKGEILALFGPMLFVLFLLIWVALLALGFGLMLLAVAKEIVPPIDSLLSALYVAGSSVLTVGAGEYVGKTTTVRLLLMVAEFNGLIITASVISLLFTVMGSIQRREVLVAVLSDIAGSPPSGITILETYSDNGQYEALGDFYHEWHVWCADILETHRAFPILAFFRSTEAVTSWLTALGAVLDSAALLLSTGQDRACLSAKLMFKSGKILINELTTGWNLGSSNSSEVGGEEIDELYQRLEKAGYCAASDREAQDRFLKLRRQYVSNQRALCDYIAVPQTPLSTVPQLSVSALQAETES